MIQRLHPLLAPKNTVDSDGFQLVKHSNRSTSQTRINQLSESNKSKLIEIVNSCSSHVDNTGRRNPNWSNAREKVFTEFPHLHRYASIESFKEAYFKISNVSVHVDIIKKSPIQNQLKKTPEQNNRFLSLTKATSFSESSTRTTSQQVVFPTATSKSAVSSASNIDKLFQIPIQTTPISTKRPREVMGNTLSPSEIPSKKILAPPVSSPVVIHKPSNTISVLSISKNFTSLERNCHITASSYYTDSPFQQLTDINDINIYFDAIKNTTDPVFTAIRMALLRLSVLSRDLSFTTTTNLSLPLKVTVTMQNTHIYESLTGHSIPADIISEKSINVIQSLIQLLKDSLILISFDIDSSSNSSTFTSLRDISIKAIENSSPFPIFNLNSIPLQQPAPVSYELSVLSKRMLNLEKLLAFQDDHIDNRTSPRHINSLVYFLLSLKAPCIMIQRTNRRYVLHPRSLCVPTWHYISHM